MLGYRIRKDSWYRLFAVSLCCCFLVGSLLGGIVAGTDDIVQRAQFGTYLYDYMRMAAEGDGFPAISALLWHHGRWFLLCFAFGVTVYGAVFLPILFGIRGFLFSFGIGCFIRIFGTVGLVPAGLLMGVSALLWLPALLICAVCVVKIGNHNIPKKAKTDHIATCTKQEIQPGLVLTFLLVFFCVCTEFFLLPLLMPGAAHLIIS